MSVFILHMEGSDEGRTRSIQLLIFSYLSFRRFRLALLHSFTLQILNKQFDSYIFFPFISFYHAFSYFLAMQYKLRLLQLRNKARVTGARAYKPGLDSRKYSSFFLVWFLIAYYMLMG